MARLAADTISVTVGGFLVPLRPTLRAAMRLSCREGGFQKLIHDIIDGHLGAYAELIGEFTSMPYLEARVWDAGVDTLKPKLIEFLLALTGSDEDTDTKGGRGPLVPFEVYHKELYRIATGWLGWPPETAWNATPAEITEAYKGRLDMLKTIFGGSDETKTETSTLTLGEKFRAAMDSFGTKKVSRRVH